MLDIYPFATLIWFKYSLDGIQHYVAVVDKWVFYINIPLALPLTRDGMDYCCTNNNKTKSMNGYKGLFKAIGSFSTEKNACFVQK